LFSEEITQKEARTREQKIKRTICSKQQEAAAAEVDKQEEQIRCNTQERCKRQIF
jgi:hypothetical protein